MSDISATFGSIDTSDTALKSWRSILFDEKVFYPPLFHMPKKMFWIFEKVAIFAHGKKEGVKNFFIKKYGPSPFQRRVARISRSLSFSLKQFQSLTWNPKKGIDKVLAWFWLLVEKLLKIWKSFDFKDVEKVSRSPTAQHI